MSQCITPINKEQAQIMNDAKQQVVDEMRRPGCASDAFLDTLNISRSPTATSHDLTMQRLLNYSCRYYCKAQGISR